MKVLLEFLKTTLMGGLLVVFPLLIFYLLFGEILDAIVALATPIADLFPDGTFALRSPDILAALLILLASFVMGLAIRLQWLARLGRWLESHTFAHLPFYRAVKLAARGLIGTASEETFFGGILHNQDGSEELVYIIEEFQDGRMAILVPFAPASFTGSAKIVDATKVTRLEAGAGEISKVIAHWGVGTAEALEVPLKDESR